MKRIKLISLITLLVVLISACVSQQDAVVNRAFQGLSFATDSDRILESSFPSLNELATFLISKPDLIVSIEGHTDNTGSHAYNLLLSERRATAVKTYLTARGVEASRLTATGYSYDRPVASNDTAAGREKNRRVEFIIKPKP